MKARSSTSNRLVVGRRGPVVLVTAVGPASGARAAAAALACAASEPDWAALLIDLEEGRPPRPSLVATAGARALEERLGAHMPDAQIASRGQICCLSLSSDQEGIERTASAVPLARESAAVIHLPPSLAQAALDESRIPTTAALLRADLAKTRALTALAARDLITRGLRVAVLKRPPAWLVNRAASLGVSLPGGAFPPARTIDRLLSTQGWSESREACYRRQQDANDEE